MKKILFLFMIFVAIIGAQERNYWNIMGGSRSALMGGIVIGGVRDNSAVFYNPGAIGFVNILSHTISSDIYGLSIYRYKDGSGEGLNIVTDEFNTLPSMSSGIFSLDFIFDDLKLGYVILTKNSSKINATSRIEDFQDLIPENPYGIYLGNNQFASTFNGKENVTAQYHIDQSSEEIWGGGSISKKINEDLSIGISGFGIYKTFSLRENIDVFAVDTINFRTASNSFLNYKEIWNVSFLIKAGVAYQKDFLKLGLTITSPQISLYGKSKVAGIINSQNVFNVTDAQNNISIPVDITADDRQQNLKTKVISPFSVGFGAETAINKNLNFAFSAEFFSGLDKYTVANPSEKSFLLSLGADQKADFNSSENLKIVDEFRAVFNYGIALEFVPEDYLKTYFSFRTDFNNGVFSEDANNYLGFTEWDIYHFTLGVSVEDESSIFALGLGYSISFESNYKQLVNFGNLEINNGFYLFHAAGNASIYYQDISIILGYTYNLH